LTRLSEIIASANGTAFGAAASFAGMWVHVPERTQIRDGVLEWSDAKIVKDMRSDCIDNACLRRFVRLADGRPEQIASFAGRYGPLYLGEHGYPVDRREDLPRRQDESEPPVIGPYLRGKPLITHRYWHQEPIEGWQAWARYIGTVLVLCHELRNGERIVPDVRLKRLGFDPGPRNPDIDDDSPCLALDSQGEFELSELGETVYDRLWPWRVIDWLDQCQTADEQWDALVGDVNLRLFEVVRYSVVFGGTINSPQVILAQPFRHRLSLHVHRVLPTIAGQLLAAISGGERTQLCADCRLPYPVERRRHNGRCPECRMKARSASAQRSKAKRRAQSPALNTPKLPQKPRTTTNDDG
jgi:hypothetical protein